MLLYAAPMQVRPGPQPVLPTLSQTATPPIAEQALGERHETTVSDFLTAVLAQHTSPASQSSAWVQQPDIAAHVPAGAHVAGLPA